MMKRFTIHVLTALLLLAAVVQAAPVNKTKAKKAFKGWVRSGPSQMGLDLSKKKVSTSETFSDDEGIALFHVIHFTSGGYVVLSADDLLEPVIAFSNDGAFSDDPENPLFVLLSTDMADRMVVCEAYGNQDFSTDANESKKEQKIRKHFSKKAARWDRLIENESVEFAASSTEAGTSSIDDVWVDTLVTTHWNQSSPEDEYTPNGYVCGCVATAMAQLMRYHSYPTAGIGVRSNTIKVDDVSESASTRGGDGAGGPYNWSGMPNWPGGSDVAVGALTSDAGISVGMSYTSSSSGVDTGKAASAFTGWFDYASAKRVYISDTASEDQIHKMVNANLDASYPVLFGIQDSSDGGGHAIVCDGYGYNSSVAYHHLNMGWAGSNDAWYNLPNIDSGWSSYDRVYKIVFNVFPNDGGAIISGRVLDPFGNPISAVDVEAQNGTDTFTATSNSKGIYCFAHVPSGTYSVRSTSHNATIEAVVIGNTSSIDTCPNEWGVDLVVEDPVIPGRVEAENYDEGGEGVAYHDQTTGNNWGIYRNDDVDITTITSGGYQVGAAHPDEWLTYTVDVDETDLYFFSTRIATPNAGQQVRLSIDGTVLATVTLPSTAAWDNWQTITAGPFSIAAGDDRVLKVEMVSPDNNYIANFDWFEFDVLNGAVATEDAYVKGGSDSATNFGSSSALVVAENSSASNDYESYIKFPISPAVSSIDSASLRLSVITSVPNETVQLYLVTDDSWQEGSITYDNRPLAGTLIESKTVPDVGGSIVFDVTSALQSELAGDGVVSFKLVEPTDSVHIAFGSRESGDGPVLIMEGDVYSDSAADWVSAGTQPNGPWTYGTYVQDADYTTFRQFSTWFNYYGGTDSPVGGVGKMWAEISSSYPRIGKYSGAPTNDNKMPVKRWTSPMTGTIVVHYDAMPLQHADDLGVTVLINKNGAAIWEHHFDRIWSDDILNHHRMGRTTLGVQAGDVLDFAITPDGTSSADWTYYAVRIESADESVIPPCTIHWQLDEASDMPPASTFNAYDFQDRSARAGDSSGNNHHATLIYADPNVVWVPGKLGNGLIMDGTDYVVARGNDICDGSNELTLAAWVKPGSKYESGLISPTGTATYSMGFSGSGVGNPIGFKMPGSVELVASDNSCPAGVWSHVVCTWKAGQNARIYIDGDLAAEMTTNVPTDVVEVDEWYIARDRSLGGGICDAMFDDIGIWDDELSAEEVYWIYRSGEDGRNLAHVQEYMRPNIAPVVVSYSTNVVGGAIIALPLIGSDADGDPLSFTIDTDPVYGSIGGSGSNLTFTADLTYSGSDSLMYSAHDGLAGSNLGVINITVEENVDYDDDGLPNAWEVQYFSSAINALPSGDPDGDALKNLAEYAFGGNPTNAADQGTSPWIENMPSGIEYIFMLRDDPDLQATILTAPDCVSDNWSTNAVQSGASGSGYSYYTNSLPDADQLFIKLMIKK